MHTHTRAHTSFIKKKNEWTNVRWDNSRIKKVKKEEEEDDDE